jgi:ribosomal protein L31E
MPPEGSWIKYQLDLRNIKLEAVAKKAHRTISMVSQVITGVKNSEAVGLALAKTLGYATYKDLMETAHLQVKGGAA